MNTSIMEKNLKRFESILPTIPKEYLEKRKKHIEEKTIQLAEEAKFYEKERREERLYKKRWKIENAEIKQRDIERSRARERLRERILQLEKQRDVERVRKEEIAFIKERQRGRDLQRQKNEKREKERSLERAHERGLKDDRNQEKDAIRANALERAKTRKRWRLAERRREKKRKIIWQEERKKELQEKTKWNMERQHDKERRYEMHKEREQERNNERVDLHCQIIETWNEGRRERLRIKEHDLNCLNQKKLDMEYMNEIWKHAKRNYEKNKANYQHDTEVAKLKIKNCSLAKMAWDDECTDKRDWQKEQERDKLNCKKWNSQLKRLLFRFKNS